MDTHVITHVDLDGYCSGAIVKMLYPDAIVHPYNYARYSKFMDKIAPGSRVFVLDCCCPMEYMLWLNTECDLTWIDHHDEETKASKGTPLELVKGCRPEQGNKIAACELTWQYCFPDKPMPRVVSLIGRFDVWDHDAKKDTFALQFGLGSIDLVPFDKHMYLWYQLFKSDDEPRDGNLLDVYLNNGRIIYNYVRNQNFKEARYLSEERTIDGRLCIVANKGNSTSIFFDSVIKPEHEFVVLYHRRPDGNWKYSLFLNNKNTTTDVNVGSLARKLSDEDPLATSNGGGKREAAGCLLSRTIEQISSPVVVG
jgi:hypothetical protein